MGLLDNTYLGSLFDDWKKQSQGMDGFQDYTETQGSGSLETAGGKPSISPLLKDRKGGSPLTQPGGQMFPTSIVPQNVLNKDKTNKAPMPMKEPSDPIVTGGQGTQQADMGFLQRLSNMAGVDMDKAMATWKDKGGFEGLMANPAFTIGLAFMQAGAEGKSLGQGALDNVLKAGAISQNYKKIIESRQGGVIEATEGQMDQIKSVLKSKGMDKPSWWRKMFPGNQSESYEQAVEDIVMKVQIKVREMKRAAKASGKDIVVGNRLYKKIIDDMIASGEISKVGGINIGGAQIIDATLEAEKREHGGPVEAGKPYVVGEVGPEIIIPTSDGNVLSNDDSQIFNMLLASNPQLQKVSKQRAEKILRARFPEYFE